MRLLERDDTGEFRLTDDFPNNKTYPYAILSHTWGDEEVLFRDLIDGTAKNKAGYAKIRFCGDQAWRDGLKFFWVDTCCIDKSNSTELQEAINSMFRWYHDATKCYAYLGDVSTPTHNVDDKSVWEPSFRASRWFTRGWTLQELIAPTSIEFFSREEVRLGDRVSLEQVIYDVTGIPLEALRGGRLSDFAVRDRMAWIEKRKTTREEDIAYSLFGIFDVQLPLLYGEGQEKALRRLREEIGKDDACLANLRSTNPRFDKERIVEAKGGLVINAYRWVLDNPDFNRWRDLPESRLLWIKGDPGKGKTMLLCGITNELERAIAAERHCCNLAYFFCQATDSRINNATAVLRGLIYLLARQQPCLLSHLRDSEAGKSLSEDAVAWVALSKILWEMLEDPNLKVTYLVVDALDECVTGLPKLLEFIIRITSERVKWLLSSRNEVTIEEKLKSDVGRARLSLELDANAIQVSHAVDAYIDDKLSSLVSLQDNILLKNQVRNILRQKANGTFLWVALVVQELSKDDVESWHTLQIVEEVPPGLDGMYDRMLNRISRYKRDSEFCRRILSVATLAYHPLHLAEIGSLSGLPEQILRSTDNVRKVVAKCGSFLTVRDDQIYLIHQSAKDYLCTSALLFPCGVPMAHHEIYTRSLSLMSERLRRDMYGLGAPGFPINQVRAPEPDPLAALRYSCVYWVSHLSDSVPSTNANLGILLRDNGPVHTFLENMYLYWLEALSLLRVMSAGIIAIRQLESLLGRANRCQLTALVRDAHRFALAYGWIVEQAPLQAYTSALVFAPACSLVKKKFKTEEPGWISTKPVVEADWNACLQTLEGHNSSVCSIAFSPDGQKLASGSNDNTVKIWNPTSGQCLQTLKGHSSWVYSVAFSPDGRRLASSSDDIVKIWDLVSGQCIQTLKGHNNWIYSVAFSPNGQQLAWGSDDTVKIWDLASGQCFQTLKGHSSWVCSVAFSPNGQQLASGSSDNTIKIWDTTSGQCVQTLKGHNSSVYSVAFSLNGQQLASGSGDNTVKIWDPASGQCIQTLKGHNDWVYSVAFSLDGQQLASGSSDNTVKIWDPTLERYLQTLKGHNDSVCSIAFSLDGQKLASGSRDDTVKIWDPTSGQYLQTLKGHSSWIYSVAFSLDGQQLASGSDDNTIKIWNPTSGRCLQTLKGHSSSVCSVTFSPDGQKLVSGSSDNTVKIWDTTSGQCIQTLTGHSSWVYSVAFSPDSRRLASGSDDTVKIRDPTLWQCLQMLEVYNGSGYSVALLPDNLEGHRYSLGEDQTWIVCNGRNVLWLPPEYRPNCSAVQGRMISIGCRSGRVFTIGFS